MALAPLLYLVALTCRNYIDTPYYDSWSLYYHLSKFMNGDSSWWAFLHAQQNEARPAFPRLLLFLVHSMNRDLGIVVVLNIALAVATAVLTLLILRKVNPGINWHWLLAAGAFFNLNFFSIAQWQNWNWHNQIIMLVPNLFFALAWLINVSSLSALTRSALVSLCCAISTFSFANGLLQWFLVVPLAFGLTRKEKIRIWGLYLGVAVLCFVLYFEGFKIPGHDRAGGGLGNGRRLITYFFAWIGSSLSAGSLALAQICGAVLVLTFLLVAIQCWKEWRRDGLQIAWLPWLSMSCYGLISGALADVARSHIGLDQALRPRYCTISQWFIVGVFGLAVTMLWRMRERAPTQARLAMSLLAVLSAGFIWLNARHAAYASEQWKGFSESMHFQKQSFGLEKAQPGQLWTFQFPNDKKRFVVFAYNEMQKAGFLRDFYRSSKILPLLAAHETGAPSDGEVTAAAYLPTREIKCSGWSVGGNEEAGNRVLVVLILPGNGKVLAVGDGPINHRRRDIIRAKRASSNSLAGFDLQFRIPKLNPGKYLLAAFRYGRDERHYYPIGAPVALQISKYRRKTKCPIRRGELLSGTLRKCDAVLVIHPSPFLIEDGTKARGLDEGNQLRRRQIVMP